MIVRINEKGNSRQVDLNSFNKDVISFGRQPDCDIVLKSDTISRVHGAFYFDQGVWIIEDLKSRNGLTLDGKKVKRATAKVGREFILYNSKDKGKVSLSILQSSDGIGQLKPEAKSKPVVQQIQPVNVTDGNDVNTENAALSDEPRKSNKKRNIIIGVVAAAALIAVVAILVNINWMSKEEKAYYKYLAELVEDADDASEVNIVSVNKEETIYYNFYAIADFDGDKKDELFILKDIDYGFSKDSEAEFYEYVDGEVKFESGYEMGSDEYPFTFYDNGVVKMSSYEFDNEVYYAGVHDGYLEDIGLLPLDGARGETYNSYDGAICVECEEDYSGNLAYYVWIDEWDEMTTLTETEYKEIFEFDAEVLDVKLYEFDVEVIADKNRDDVEDYAVYKNIDKIDELESFYESDEKYGTYGAWDIVVYDNETATISDYDGPQTEIIIPETLGGYSVIGIGEINCEYVEKVKIPEGVKYIYDEAFYGCGKLTSISIPCSVEIIGIEAFNACHSLENVIIPEGVKRIDLYAFGGNDDLTVELPDSLEFLSEKAIGYSIIDGENKKSKNCTIIGSKGSLAEEYAEDNNFNFKEK
ncbi:MAG: FHA domain-containing protein [Lachnospiraceae bacterium]|nr:FHA domain-containing protein [Lachnospiraceae bacterium]